MAARDSKDSKDLVVLVADVQQEKTIATLLQERSQSLGIPSTLQYEIYPHPLRDPGVYQNAVKFLEPFIETYTHAFVVLDAQWDGSPKKKNIETELRAGLEKSGWATGHSEVIVLEPELEIWVWVNSPHLKSVLGLSYEEVKVKGIQKGYWREEASKPHSPKELLEGILREQKKPRSSAIFQQIARDVSLKSCTDASFVLFRETLQRWFSE
jgi:hypothetical protein